MLLTGLTYFAAVGMLILALMTLLWLISLWRRDASIVDIFWGSGFVIAVWTYFLLTSLNAAEPQGFTGRKWLITALVTIWGLRLSLYLLWRNWGKPEDPRYRAWRTAAGASWPWRSLFKVFWLQGAILWVVSAPLLAAQLRPTPPHFTWLDAVGVLVWLIGFIFEAGGDWQLARFRANPANRGQVLMTGLWRFTRHPNYFGDAAQWWGFYLIALAAGGWYTIFAPAIMHYLLRRVSGVALLERSLSVQKTGYAAYVAHTNAFYPWFPRRGNLAGQE